MKKVLLISINHYNNKVADAVQNIRLFGEIGKSVDVDIVCRVSNKSHGAFEVYSPNLYIVDRIIYKLFPFLISIFCLDRFVWCIATYFRINKIVSKYDAIIFTYEPFTLFLLHILVRAKNVKRIVSIFYDPYVDNIFLSTNKIAVYLRRKIEYLIVNKSSVTVLNNNKTYRRFITRYPSANLELVPLCGLAGKVNSQDNKTEKRTIIHAGNIYGKRSIDQLNEAVTQAKTMIDDLHEKLEILLYGTVCVGYDRVLSMSNNDIIKFCGCLSQDDLREKMKTADALLLIDPLDENNYCFPSKLCEYFQYDKIIIGIAGLNTPSYDALKESGHIVSDSNDISKISDAIVSIANNKKSISSKIDKSYSIRFDIPKVAEAYLRII